MRLPAAMFVVLVACAQGRAAGPATPQEPARTDARTSAPPAASREQILAATKDKLRNYAFEAFPSWAVAHPDTDCPANLAALNEYLLGPKVNDTNDAWGRPLKLLCGADLPGGARGIGVASIGADGKDGTDDDIKWWNLGD